MDEAQNVHYRLPKALPIAFLRLGMVFVAFRALLLSNDHEERAEVDQVFTRYALECRQRLLEGRDQFMLMLYTFDHRDHADYEAIDPTAFLGIMMSNLLDISSSKSKSKFDITQTYSDYTTKVVGIFLRCSSTLSNGIWSGLF